MGSSQIWGSLKGAHGALRPAIREVLAPADWPPALQTMRTHASFVSLLLQFVGLPGVAGSAGTDDHSSVGAPTRGLQRSMVTDPVVGVAPRPPMLH
eukprot:2671767-Pyramimonas_sp.AAC.1